MSSDRKNDLVWGNVRLPICPPRDPSHRYWSTLDGGKTWVQDSTENRDDKIESGYYQLEFTPEELIVLVERAAGLFVSAQLQIPLQYKSTGSGFVEPISTDQNPVGIAPHPDSQGNPAKKVSPIFKGGRCRWLKFKFDKRELLLEGSKDLPNFPDMDDSDFTEEDETDIGNRTPDNVDYWNWYDIYQGGRSLAEFGQLVFLLNENVESEVSYYISTHAIFEGDSDSTGRIPFIGQGEDPGAQINEGLGDRAPLMLYETLASHRPFGPAEPVLVLTRLKLTLQESLDEMGEIIGEYTIADYETSDLVEEFETNFELTGDMDPAFYAVDREGADDIAPRIGFERSNSLYLSGSIWYDVPNGGRGYLVRESVLQGLIDDFNAAGYTVASMQAFADGLQAEMQWIRDTWMDSTKMPKIQVRGNEEGAHGPSYYIAFDADIPVNAQSYPDVMSSMNLRDWIDSEFAAMEEVLEASPDDYAERWADLGAQFIASDTDGAISLGWGGVDIYESTFEEFVIFQEGGSVRPAGDYYAIPGTAYLPTLSASYNSYYEFVLDFNDLLYDGATGKYRVRFSCEWYVVSAYSVSIRTITPENQPPADGSLNWGTQLVNIAICSSMGFMRERDISDLPALPYTKVVASDPEPKVTIKPFDFFNLHDALQNKEITIWKYYMEPMDGVVGEVSGAASVVDVVDLMEGDGGTIATPQFGFNDIVIDF